MFYKRGHGWPWLPGEVWLAHRGARVPDMLPECRRYVLEVLRQLLEDGII